MGIDVSDRRLAAKRREAARQAVTNGESIRATARNLGVTPATVRGYVRDRASKPARTPMARELLLDAGWAYRSRFGLLPTAATWNATDAREQGAWCWQCFREGWGPVGGRWGSWPQPQDVTLVFGSWPEFHVALQTEFRLLPKPYEPRAVPPGRLSTATLEAFCLDRWPEGSKTQVPEWLLLPEPWLSLEPGRRPPVMMTVAGPIGIPGPIDRGDTSVVGVCGTGRSSVLQRLVATDVGLQNTAVVVVERVDKPSIGGGLATALSIDMAELATRGDAVIVRSNDEATRAMAIIYAAHACLDTGRHVSLIIDDAEDVIDALAYLLRLKPPTLHLSVAWRPKLTLEDVTVWFMSSTRFLGRLDAEVAEPFWRVIEWETLAADLDGRPPGDVFATTIPRERLLSRCAAIEDVPEPRNGSHTRSPLFVPREMQRPGSA